MPGPTRRQRRQVPSRKRQSSATSLTANATTEPTAYPEKPGAPSALCAKAFNTCLIRAPPLDVSRTRREPFAQGAGTTCVPPESENHSLHQGSLQRPVPALLPSRPLSGPDDVPDSRNPFRDGHVCQAPQVFYRPDGGGAGGIGGRRPVRRTAQIRGIQPLGGSFSCRGPRCASRMVRRVSDSRRGAVRSL